MRSNYYRKHNGLAIRELPVSVQLLLFCLVILFAFAASANAQNVTVLNTPTTTTLWAGTQDWSVFGLSSVTSPGSGVILQGTAISTFTGRPVRHLWYGDSSNGLCRIDPEMDDPTISSTPGIGFHNNIERTCIGFIQAGGFVPLQLTYDASTNTLYAADQPRTANGVIRMHYIPAGDNGQGSMDPIHVESLMGAQGTRNGAGGCPVITDPRNGATPVQMFAATLGPDGNLYIGWARNGSIARIPHPDTFNPGDPNDCASIQVPIFASDARLGAGGAGGHTFGLAWIGHTLFGADNISPWFKDNADQCLTPANGMQRCGPVAGAGTEILGAFAPGPQAGIVSDYTYNGPNTTYAGNNLFASSLGSTVRVSNATDVNNITVTPQFGGTFCFITGVSIDTSDLANETIYVGSDCTQGSLNGAGAIWQVKPQPPAAGPPSTPVNVRATATANAATVNWIPTPNGQLISSFVVRTLLANGTASGVPDFTVNPGSNGIAPNTATITGLTNGVAIEFVVQACNVSGCSPFSVASAVVTPQALTVPGAPTGVVASGGSNASSQVAWTAPANNGGSPIVSYTVTSTPGGLTMTVPATQTGVNFTGLTNGTIYSFTVHATNSTGNSAESAPSNQVLPIAPVGADLAIAMTSPATVNAGAFVTFAMTITNNGPGDAALVTLTDTLPGTFQSATTSQGICNHTGAVFTCTLGALVAGNHATVNVTVVSGNTSITNTASVQLRDASGNLINETVGGNNVASSTTNVTVPVTGGGGGGTPAGVSADIEVKGSARNGGPNAGTGDTFTWQIKNNTGNTAVSNVVFTLPLPPNFQFVDASASQGTCGGIAANAIGGTLTCNLASLPGGQTMIVTVDFVPLNAGTFSTTGSGTFTGTDTNTANNSFTVTIQPK